MAATRIKQVPVSFGIDMFELSRHRVFFWQSVTEIAAGKWGIRPFSSVNHQIVEIKHLPPSQVMPVVFGKVAEIVIGNDDASPYFSFSSPPRSSTTDFPNATVSRAAPASPSARCARRTGTPSENARRPERERI
jgi:hypothetical protein